VIGFSVRCSTRKRIMLVTRSGIIGGVEEHVCNLAKYLINRGYGVLWVVLSRDGISPRYRAIPGIRFVVLEDPPVSG